MYELPTLKQVSRIKHRILEKYLPPWMQILGASHRRLVYIDCYGGTGKYSAGEPGSPVIALRVAAEFVREKGGKAYLIFVEKSESTCDILSKVLGEENVDHRDVAYTVISTEAENFTDKLLRKLPQDIPAFFFVDPYRYPLTIPLLNRILERPRTEVLINLMWYQINRDLSNLQCRDDLNKMFGCEEWQTKRFMSLEKVNREKGFLEYFMTLVSGKYKVPFCVKYSPEDNVPNPETRTKYYLVHVSNHPKAVSLMKSVMWALGDEDGLFAYSGHRDTSSLFRPNSGELKIEITRKYDGSGRTLSFEQIIEETHDWLFLEKHYRKALKELEKEDAVVIRRIDSKKDGLKGNDSITFC